MALFKNLYLDLSYLNPFKKNENKRQETFTNQPVIQQPSFSQPIPTKKFRELPDISKRLLDEKKETVVETKGEAEKTELPKIKKAVMPPPILNGQSSNNIINNINNIKETKETIQEPQQPMTNSSSADTSFFSTLYNHLSKEENYMHRALSNQVFSKDLVEEMQSFWHNKKDELSQTTFNKTLKADLMAKMSELQQLEAEWQNLQLQHEKVKDELSSKEILIETNVRQMKKSFKKLQWSTNINFEHFFVLSNGNKLKNLQELEDSLKTMNADVFNFHVNESKNDFANWINDVMGLNELAQNVREVKTKEQISELIDNWYNSI